MFSFLVDLVPNPIHKDKQSNCAKIAITHIFVHKAVLVFTLLHFRKLGGPCTLTGFDALAMIRIILTYAQLLLVPFHAPSPL